MNDQILDTTVLIDLSRGSPDAADFIDTAFKSGAALFISVISAMELIAGCRNQPEVKKAQKLIAELNLVHLTPTISTKAYNLMLTYSKSNGLAIPDALIASTAITHRLELASDNTRHFKMIPDLSVKRPYLPHGSADYKKPALASRFFVINPLSHTARFPRPQQYGNW